MSLRGVRRDTRLSRWPLWHSTRTFQVIQRGHDRPQESLFDKLGFSKDNEAHRVRRTIPELQQGLLRQVESLADPLTNAADQKRLAELKNAYTLLYDDNFRANYGSHYYASNDAQLHVLCDGGQVAANYNPEHQQFTYVDHAIDKDGHAALDGVHNARAGTATTPGASGLRSSAEAPTAEALRDAFRSATGVGDGASGATSSSARAFSAAEAAGPTKGSDITHLLRLSLEQSLAGCEVTVELRKIVACTSCKASGRQRLSKPRKCPQCLGRGSTHMPSATYHIERRCLYCGGEGTVPAPLCRACEGRGVQLHVPTSVTVSVPAGTVSNSLFRLRHHGHDGVRGGHAGDLLVTVMVSEHRYFFHRKERPGELHAMLPLPLSVALLGGRVEVPTLAGRGVLHVPPCVRNGQVLAFDVYGVTNAGKAEGAGGPSSPSPSQLYFHALVMIPRVSDLSGRQLEALNLYEQRHQQTPAPMPAASTDVDGLASEAVLDTAEMHERQSSSAAQTSRPSSPPVKASRDALMEECAALKNVYKHWLTSN